jgi:hypothetical protein
MSTKGTASKGKTQVVTKTITKVTKKVITTEKISEPKPKTTKKTK